MLSELPDTIDPMRLAKAGEGLSGSYDLHQLSRVNALLEDDSNVQVSFQLEFSRDVENRLFSIIGFLEATLPLVCQRCMEPMQHRLDGTIKMAIISDDAEVENLPAPFEPFIDSGEPVSLQDFIEDELLLAMPLVSLHEDKVCPAANKFRHEHKFELEHRAKENPFAELKNFKLRN